MLSRGSYGGLCGNYGIYVTSVVIFQLAKRRPRNNHVDLVLSRRPRNCREITTSHYVSWKSHYVAFIREGFK